MIAHCSKMAVNVSQLIEYCGDNTNFLSNIFDLSDAGLITLISSAPTIDEFISSRRQIYQHDRQRYPMYFDDSASFATRFKIGQINTASTTTVLTRRIFDWGEDLFDPVNRVMNELDRQVARESRELIQQITMKGLGQAVTRTMYRGEYNGRRLSPEALAIAGRMISGIYIDQYRSEYEFAQCCGVPGLQYYDQERWFPYYDFNLVTHLRDLLGYADLRHTKQSTIRYQRLSLYNSEEHRAFVGLFNVLLESTMFCVIAEGNRIKLTIANLAGVRSQMANVLSALSERVGSPSKPIMDLKQFFVGGSEKLIKMSRVGSAASQAFAARWVENMEPVEPTKKILLLTATDVEDQMLLRELRAEGYSVAEPRQLGNTISRVFAPRGGVQVYHVRSNAGSSGSGGSALTAVDAVDALQPDFVISVGIAFGIDKESQSMHDLLISTRIWNYEPCLSG